MFSSSGILCRRSNWNEIKLLHGHRTSCKRQKYSYLYFMQRKRDMGQSDVSIAPNSSAAAPEFLSFKSQQHSHSAINTWNSKILFPFLVKFLFFSNTETYYVEKKAFLLLSHGKYWNCPCKIKNLLKCVWGRGRAWPRQDLGSSLCIDKWTGHHNDSQS